MAIADELLEAVRLAIDNARAETTVVRKRIVFRQGESSPRIVVALANEYEYPAPESKKFVEYTVVVGYIEKTAGELNDPSALNEARNEIRNTCNQLLTLSVPMMQVESMARPAIDVSALASYYDYFVCAIVYTTLEETS